MELAVYKTNGDKTSKKVTLDDKVFAIEPNDHAIYLDVKQYMANQRQGTHSSLERSQISGSTKKLKRQKGTGTARFGSIKNPIFRGGPRVFGPHPRDYGFKLNKKVKRLARLSAFSYRAKENSIMVLEDFDFESPRTRNVVEMLENLKLGKEKALFVFPKASRNIILSCRNLKRVKVINAYELNTYDILNAGRIMFVESSIPELERLFSESKQQIVNE